MPHEGPFSTAVRSDLGQALTEPDEDRDEARTESRFGASSDLRRLRSGKPDPTERSQRGEQFRDVQAGSSSAPVRRSLADRAKSAVGGFLSKATDKALLAPARVATRAMDPLDRNPLLDITESQLHVGTDNREARLESALSRFADEAREGGVDLDEDIIPGTGIDAAAVAALARLGGDVGREAAYSVPAVAVAGPLGSVAARGIPAAARSGRLVRAVEGAYRGAARGAIEFPAFVGTRETIEEGDVNEQVVEAARHSLTGEIEVGPVKVPAWALLALPAAGSASRGYAVGKAENARKAAFAAKVAENQAEVAGASIISTAGGRVWKFPSGEVVPESALVELYSRAPGLEEAVAARAAQGGIPESAAITPRRPTIEPAASSPFRRAVASDLGPRRALPPGQPQTAVELGGAFRPPKVSQMEVGGQRFEVVEAEGLGGVLVRDSQAVAGLPPNRPTVVIARELSDNPELLSQVELAARQFFDERGIALIDKQPRLTDPTTEATAAVGDAALLDTVRSAKTKARLESQFSDEPAAFIPEYHMPEEGLADGLWHVTGSGESISREGLVSRAQLREKGVKTEGLGGGFADVAPDKVSVTVSSGKAHQIAEDLRMASRAARDQADAVEILNHNLRKYPDAESLPSNAWENVAERVGRELGGDDMAREWRTRIEEAAESGDEFAAISALEEIVKFEIDHAVDSPIAIGRAKYELMQALDGEIGMQLRSMMFDPNGLAVETTGLTAPFESVFAIDPEAITVLRVRARQNAFSDYIPQELELRFDPRDVEVVREGSNIGLTHGEAPRVTRTPTGELLNDSGTARLAGDEVSGFRVRDEVPNLSSIRSSLTDYEVLRGVREVPMSSMEVRDAKGLFYAADDRARVRQLTEEIRESGEVSPLIVVEDAEGLYILEGAHRMAALESLGAESFPAVVVRDLEGVARRSSFLADERGIATLEPEPGPNRPQRAARQAAATSQPQQQQQVAQAATTAANTATGAPTAPATSRIGRAAQSLGRVIRGAWENPSTLMQAKRLNLNRVATWAEKDLGEPGRVYVGQLRDTRNTAATRAGTNFEDLRATNRRFRLKKADREEIARAVHFREVDQLSERLQSAAVRLNAIFDRGLRTLRDAGFKREGQVIAGSGRFLPQILTDEAAQYVKAAVTNPSGGVAKGAAARLVRDGFAKDEQAALRMLKAFHDKNVQGDLGYYTRHRNQVPEDWIKLDYMEWAEDFFEADAMFVEGWRTWGTNHEQAKSLFEQIAQEVGRGEADFLEHHHRVQFGQTAKIPQAQRRLIAGISNYITASKLSSPFTTIRQIGQRFINTSDLPISAVIQTTKDIPPIIGRFFRESQRLGREARKSGSVQARATATQDIIQGGRGEFDVVPGEGAPTRVLRTTGFLQGEEGNQIFTAIAAKRALETALTKYLQKEPRSYLGQVLEHIKEFTLPRVQLKGGPRVSSGVTAKNRRLVERLTEDEAHMRRVVEAWKNGERIDPADLQAVMIKANRDRNFVLDAFTKPVKWDTNPTYRLALKFKPFMAKQFAYMWRNVYSEAVKGNLAPAVKAIAAGTVVAEVWNLMRDVFLGRQDAIITQLMKDPAQLDEWHEWAGEVLIQHQLDAATIGLFSDLVWGWDNFVFGPGFGTAENTGELLFQNMQLRQGKTGTLRQAVIALDDFLKREIPAVKLGTSAITKADSWFQPKENKYHDWRRIRNETFRFAEELEQPLMVDRLREDVADVSRGREGFEPTENTFFYAYAWENMMLGDYDDAADYLVEIMKGEEDKGGARRKISQSMRSQAPLGAITRARDWKTHPEVQAYLETLSPEARREVVSLQNEYLKRGNRVWNIARRRAGW